MVALGIDTINGCQLETARWKTYGNGFSWIGTQHTKARKPHATWHMNTALRASAYEVTAATRRVVGSSGMIVVLWRIRSMICGGRTRGSAERAGDCESGSHLESLRSRDPLPKLFREDSLKKRPAQADPKHLAGRPEKIGDTRSDGYVLLGYVRNHGL